ncbi:MAG TPA: hypothetical protein VFO57_01750 [Burkholderiales bacterium]|nr:hypothetical protein [Burkholderiales bacterium]
MGTRSEQRRARIPAPHEDKTTGLAEIAFEEEDETPCSEYVVMSQERDLPALEEYLREHGSRTIH